MIDSELCRERLLQYKIRGQTKPFVDHNLQIQIPGIEAELNLSSPSPVYSHYSASQTHGTPFPLPFNAAELNQAMDEARQSYVAWKKMAEKLHEEVKLYQ